MRMKALFVALLGFTVLAGPVLAAGSVSVRGYTRSDGTYVAPHMRSAPDSTVNNNWTTQGNTNPYTGSEGTKPQNPYEPYQPYQPYGSTP